MAKFYFKTADGRTSRIEASSQEEANQKAQKIAGKESTSVQGGVSSTRPTSSQGSFSFEGSTGEVPFRNETQATLGGYYGQDAAEQQYRTDLKSRSFSEPKLDSKGSIGIAKQYGLQGLDDNAFTGLTASKAMQKAKQLREQRMAQTSAITSYNFNPETISGFKKKFDDLKFQLDQNNDYAWSSGKEKKEKNMALVNSYVDQFAKLFPGVEEFRAAMTSPDLQNIVKKFKSIGGDMNAIESRITTPSVTAPVIETATQDTFSGPQTLDEYLGNITSPSEKKAFESLIPEKKVYQDQIAFESSIPEQYKNLYFGTEEEVGLLEQRRKQAEEEIKIKERQAKLDIKNARAQVDYAIDKANAELEIENAQIEENRLAAKNYMTGMLAKLGALKTTGAAPAALATLEQKYQQQSQKLRTTYDLYNRKLQLDLSEKVDQIDIDKDSDILKVKQDLSKGEEDILKEVFKLQTEADRKKFSIIEKYTQEFRTQKEKYAAEAKRDAEKYAEEFANSAGLYDVESFSSFINRKQQESKKNFTKSKVESLIPEFIQNVINSGNISLDAQAVLSGERKLSDYTPSEGTKIQRELTALGIDKKMLGGEFVKPDIGELLKEAKAAIDEGKDEELVRQRFLEIYPEKSSVWDNYFNQ